MLTRRRAWTQKGSRPAGSGARLHILRRVDATTIRDLAFSRYEDFVSALEQMVNVDCGSYTPAGVNRIADLCEQRFEARGWKVERRPHVPGEGEQQLGDLVIGRLEGAGGPNVLLVGHMDTVFDAGTVAERPFRIEGTTAYGPGVSDMKGGLLTGFFAVEVLQDAGFDGFGTITFVCNPDEEIGSPFSGPVIRDLAPANDAALVLEGARANGDIVSARKGVTDYLITIRGRAAHAGVEPEKGRSALLEAAHKILALQALNGRWPGVTVNVGVARGGTRTNVVPQHCELQVDLRSALAEMLDGADEEIRRICAEAVVPDVTVEVVGNGWHRPMEKKEGGERLVAIAVRVASELGFELRDAATGGASDANTTSAAGTPTIDGLGPIGGDDHAPAEWIDLESVVPRVALLAGIVSRL
ncbi:MAG: M20 family metallopeptidase [Actinobacteria bacterium]|nr:M20 family metallopeptidase [Actinomycetota bacterium]